MGTVVVTEVGTLRRLIGLGAHEKGNHELPTYFAKLRVVEAMQELFSHHLGGLRWSDDEKATEVQIADVYGLNFESVDNKPSIILRRVNTTWEHRGIGQFLESWGQAAAPVYTDHRQCSMVAHCLGRNGLEAEFVADVLDSGFAYFRHIISRVPKIIDIRMQGIGTEALVRSDSDTELATVPVNFIIHFQQTWMVRPTGAPPIRDIRFNAGIDP